MPPTPAPPADGPTPEPTWLMLKDAVADAFDLDPELWPEALHKALNGDAELIRQANAMLQAGSGSTAQLVDGVDAFVGNDAPDPYALIGQVVGGYTVDRLIAEGGMGAVYAAKQERPARTVALKVLRPGSVADDTRMRFGREVTALGRLKHPNIAQIYDAGVYRPSGGSKLPYLVMEFVDGDSLTSYARNAKLQLPDKLKLLAKVADAVHAAHQQAIIHRDLKPANILVGKDGEPKVLDFGIARLADENTFEATSHTATGTLLGTLAYMSPEQVRGENNIADARADVYALGVLLYELVMGKPPVDVRNQPLPVALQRISEERTINLGVGYDHDLQTIIATAMAHDVTRRYGSASELAADLRRHLNNDPIAARPPTTRYLLTKFAQRHRGPLAAAVVFVLLLIGATVLASVGFIKANAQRQIAEVATADAQAQQALAQDRQREAEDQRAEAESQRAEAESQRRIAEGATADAIAQRMIADAQRAQAIAARADADRERDNALSEQRRAEAVNTFLFNMLGAPDPDVLGRDITVLDTIDLYIGNVETTFADQPVTRASLYSVLGWTYYALGEYGKARPILEESVALYREHAGPFEQETLTALGHLANVLADQDDYDALETLLEDVVPGAIAAHGRGNDTVLLFQTLRADLLSYRGRFEEADAVYAEAIRVARKSLGEDNDLALSLMNNYGSFLIEQEDYDRAETILAEVVSRRRASPNTATNDLAISLSNLAGVFESQGRYDEADAIYAEGMDLLIQTLGEGHDTTLSLMMARITTLQALGKTEQATDLAREVVRLRTEHFGEDHLDTLNAMNNFAVQLVYAKQYEEAVGVARSAYEGMRGIFGDNHPTVWRAEQNYASSLDGIGRHAEAEVLLQRGLTRLRKHDGWNATSTLVQANNLAMCLHAQEHYTQALSLMEDAIDRGAGTLPAPYLAAFHRNAGRCAAGAEQYETAERHLLRSYDMLRDEPGGASRARTARFLADLYRDWGKPDLEAQYRAVAEPAD